MSESTRHRAAAGRVEGAAPDAGAGAVVHWRAERERRRGEQRDPGSLPRGEEGGGGVDLNTKDKTYPIITRIPQRGSGLWISRLIVMKSKTNMGI